MSKQILSILFLLLVIGVCSAQEPKYHTVQLKETLYSLSRLYGASVSEIKSWNNLGSNNITVGQKLIVGYATKTKPGGINKPNTRQIEKYSNSHSPKENTSGSWDDSEVLTNSSIIKLHKLGLGESVIISKIQDSQTNFDVSIDGLIALKSAKVPDAVVNAMMEADKVDAIKNADPNDPLSPHEGGIYFFNRSDSTLSKLDPTVPSEMKTSGGWGSSFSYGISSVSTLMILSGKSANFVVNSNQPVWYFYFEEVEDANPGFYYAGDWWFKIASTPNEFILAKFEGRSSRELKVGSSNAAGSSMGVHPKLRMEFEFEKLADKIYKVTPKTVLEDGEYCFLYSGAVPAGQSASQKVFDFSIQTQK